MSSADSTLAIDELIPRHIRELTPYQPGKPVEELERELGISGAIKLASNENPLGPSPRAVEAMTRAIADSHLYPDDGVFRLRRAVAERLEVAPDELVFGAGSNELIYLLVGALCQPGDQVLTHQFAFISYALAARAYDVELVTAPATPPGAGALGCDVEALIAAMSPRTKLVLLANPNNPTGSHLTAAQLERVLAALPPRAFLVIDEAYHEYALAAGEGVEGIDYGRAIRYRADAPRLILLRTFSKLYGLAGLRVGYGIGERRVIDYVNRLRRAFNVGSLAQVAALAALDDVDHARRAVEVARASIARMRAELTIPGVTVYPSLANFALIDVGRPSQPVYDALLARGVITRPMAGWGLPHHLRVSVGTAEQTTRLVAAMRDALG
jgi:histidinol-phosphate aminotransferase